MAIANKSQVLFYFYFYLDNQNLRFIIFYQIFKVMIIIHWSIFLFQSPKFQNIVLDKTTG